MSSQLLFVLKWKVKSSSAFAVCACNEKRESCKPCLHFLCSHGSERYKASHAFTSCVRTNDSLYSSCSPALAACARRYMRIMQIMPSHVALVGIPGHRRVPMPRDTQAQAHTNATPPLRDQSALSRFDAKTRQPNTPRGICVYQHYEFGVLPVSTEPSGLGAHQPTRKHPHKMCGTSSMPETHGHLRLQPFGKQRAPDSREL